MRAAMRRVLALGALGTAILALVSGCYFSNDRLIANGEEVGFKSGTYVCRGTSTETVDVVRRVDTTPAGPDVVYRVERTDYRFTKLGNGLYLVQGTETSNFSYAFADYSDGSQLRILYRDPKAIERSQALAQKHGVQFKTYLNDAGGGDMLLGTPVAIRAFLTAHDASMLLERVSCSRPR